MATGSTTWLSNTRRVKSTLRFVFALAFVSQLVACGGGGGGGSSSSSGPAPTPSPALSLLAGNADGFGNVDGTGSAARFGFPGAIAVDSSGNSYVADSHNHTIRKITVAGVVTTLAGTTGTCGSADGTGSAASFCNPSGVAVDGSGNLYVTDSSNHTIRKITSAGIVTTLAGTAHAEGNTDGTGAAARFDFPSGIALDTAGNIYVSSWYQHTIRKIDATGLVTTLAGTAGTPGSTDGTGTAASFNGPAGITVDIAGNVYVADEYNHTIRKITPTGDVTTLAGTAGVYGTKDGIGATASFASPSDVTLDSSSGNLYVTDQYTIRKVTADGTVSTLAGSPILDGSADGTGTSARFNYPSGIAMDSAGILYVADGHNHTVRKITAAGVVTTLAGKAGNSGIANGTGDMSSFFGPHGIAVDGSGNVFVAEESGFTIRKISPTGSTITLNDGSSGSGSIPSPDSVALDGSGNVYATSWSNHTILKITPAGAVTTLAGAAGMSGSIDGAGTEARFLRPEGIATDSTGNIYVADSGNDTIRKITPAGVVTTLAGLAGSDGSADGAGAAARFNYPTGIAVDNAGNVYVGDTDNHTIRKITPTGMVTTLAGSPGNPGSADGVGTNARFNSPNGVAVDGTGNVYVADRGNHTIRKITPAGAVTTVVGQAGMASFVPGALPGLLTAPIGVAIGGGTLYITTNNAVVKVSNVP